MNWLTILATSVLLLTTGCDRDKDDQNVPPEPKITSESAEQTPQR